MELPKTEKQLRLDAIKVLNEFEAQMPPEAVKCNRVPIYSFVDVMLAAAWVARRTIRQYCPDLEHSAEDDMSGQFSKDEEKFI